MEKTKVYFTKEITSESLVKIYEKLGIELKERVAVKLHSGEEGNQNYLRPEFVKDIINRVGGTVVECNTAYDGARNTTEKHKKLMTSHGWDKYYKVDIMDSEDDMILDIPNGNVINKDYVGSHLDNYDSMLVLSHFKGHPMGGYGGALKQLSIGVASSSGKAYILLVKQQMQINYGIIYQSKINLLKQWLMQHQQYIINLKVILPI